MLVESNTFKDPRAGPGELCSRTVSVAVLNRLLKPFLLT